MLTVLYVDDDPMVRTAVRRQLEQRGLSVLTAESVSEAKGHIERHDVDGACIDIWLGDGTAFDLYAWVQEHHPALAGRVVFVTGDATGQNQGKSLRALGRPVLPKPLDMNTLVQIVGEWGA